MRISQLLLSGLLVLSSCAGGHNGQNTVSFSTPEFNRDSAYMYVADQVAFGPRVPNTDAHRLCGDYLVSKLKSFGAEVTEQKAELKACDGTVLQARNIIASYHVESKRRLLLAAHWDCRPWCDQDADDANFQKPVTGANDGASGVAVLLEIARQLPGMNLPFGVDLILFDAEDYGLPAWSVEEKDDTWCLGSQYWAAHPHKEGYKAEAGILLDMVGGQNAVFLFEYFSLQYAPGLARQIWNAAADGGFDRFFIPQLGGSVVDDHYYINSVAGIPCVDIIDFDESRGFCPQWHTVNDNLDHISASSLQAVGQTVLNFMDRF